MQDTEAPYARYLYVMGMPSFGAGGAQKKFIELDGYPEIEHATCFAVHPNNPWVFYAVGNTVYYFDLEGHKAEPIHLDSETTVSYTHLDVYKRQVLWSSVKLCGTNPERCGVGK